MSLWKHGVKTDHLIEQGDLASDYCWIHGSGYIPKKYQMHMKCITNLDGVQYGNEDTESPDMVTCE